MNEAIAAVRYYAEHGEWPHFVSSGAWRIIMDTPLTELVYGEPEVGGEDPSPILRSLR